MDKSGVSAFVGRLRAALLCAVVALVVAGAGGCQSHRSAKAGERLASGLAASTITTDSVAAARSEAMAAADTYTTIISQATVELSDRTTRDDVVMWAMEQRIATALACNANATTSNAYIALLDMMVFATLKRYAVEEHWIPTLLHEEGAPVLEAFRRGERAVWKAGATVLSDEQRAELTRVINDWRAANPTQYYVSHIRFTDFADVMRVTATSAKAMTPGSVFGLLYIDPLAGLDPVARELQEFRALSERVVFLMNRTPTTIALLTDLVVRRSMRGPQVVKFVDSTSRFADATTRFSATVAKFPEDLSAERAAAVVQLDAATTRQVKAALDQAFAGIAEQRAALTNDLQGHEARLDATLAKARDVVARVGDAGRSVNAATSETIDNARKSTRSTLTYAFTLTVALIFVTLLLLLGYRIAAKRFGLVRERR